MPSRAQATVVEYWAWNYVTGQLINGDGANHLLNWVQDGVATALSSPTITDQGNGSYTLSIDSAQATCNRGMITGTSSTHYVQIIGPPIDFLVALPTVPPAAGTDTGLSTLVDADVLAQAEAALVAFRLNELLAVATTGDPLSGSFFGDLLVASAGSYIYTSAALANSPTGTGGFTSTDRTTLNNILTVQQGGAPMAEEV